MKVKVQFVKEEIVEIPDMYEAMVEDFIGEGILSDWRYKKMGKMEFEEI